MPRSTLCLSVLFCCAAYGEAKRDIEEFEDAVLLVVGANSEVGQYAQETRDSDEAATAGVSLLAVSTRTGKAAVAAAERACGGPPEHTPHFEEFVKRYNRTYAGPEEHRRRLALYQARVATIREQNCRVDSWTAAVNHLSDRSHEELKQLHGWKGAAKSHSGGGAFSFLQTEKETHWHFDYQAFKNRINAATKNRLQHHHYNDVSDEDALAAAFPRSKSWRNLKATKTVLQQGDCGSCWAFATATVLGAHSELYGERRTFSPQHLVQCVSNPQKCGGSGGCDGATVELGLEHVLQHGLATEEDLPYSGKEAACFDGPTPHVEGHKKHAPSKTRAVNDAFNAIAALLQKKHGLLSESATSEKSKSATTQKSEVATKTEVKAQAVHGLTGWQNPVHNNYRALMSALQDGPVAVALQAMDSWYSYAGGIVGDDCPAAATINHATVLVGYGEQSSWPRDGDEKQYWLIQNSWGPQWGENGFLRLKRRGQDEDKYCGWDTTPEVGNGCEGGPAKVWVCGTCGILYDPVRPVFKK